MCNKNPLIIYILLLTAASVLVSCEYERVELSTECENKSFSLNIDSNNSILSVNCGASDGEIAIELADSLRSSVALSLNEGEFMKQTVFSNLNAGNYTITAKRDNSDCISDPINIVIANKDGVTLSLVEAQNTTCGLSSGYIEVQQENGVLPVQYQLNNGAFQNDKSFEGLSSGNYTVTAVDANGCESSIPNIILTSGVSLSQDIRPIINTNCAVTGCHSGSQPPNFTDINNIIANASRIRSRTSGGSMPPSGREDLTAGEIELIACWVEDGALNN